VCAAGVEHPRNADMQNATIAGEAARTKRKRKSRMMRAAYGDRATSRSRDGAIDRSADRRAGGRITVRYGA